MNREYRAGQPVRVRTGAVPGLGSLCTEPSADCIVLCAAPNPEAYCVAAIDHSLVSVVGREDILSEPERVTPHDPAGVRVVFFGNGSFALPVLRHLVESGYDVCAVVSNPDSRQGRGRRSRATAVSEYARRKGLRLLTPVSVSDPAVLAETKRMRPDLGVVVEYGILPKALHRMPRLGTLNLHSSLLPEYRGASTVSSAIRDGRPYTGLTTFVLSDTVDGGDIVNNMFIPIGDTDNSEDVLARMRSHGPALVEDAVQVLLNGLPLTQQAVLGIFLGHTGYASKVFHDDLRVDWGRSAREVCDFIRAYSPQPAAWTDLPCDGGEPLRGVKLYRAKATAIASDGRPGTWEAAGGRLLVNASDYKVGIEELQPAGKRRMTALDFCNGQRGGRGRERPCDADGTGEEPKTKLI